MKKTICIFLTFLLLIGLFSTFSVLAKEEDTVSQDGIELTITTKKLKEGKEAKAIVEIKNTNLYDVNNLKLNISVPKGLSVKSGEAETNGIKIASHDTYTQEIILSTSNASRTTILIIIVISSGVILLAAAITTIVIVARKKKKKSFKNMSTYVCLLLCVSLLFSYLPLCSSAESNDLNLSVSEKVKIKDKSYTITATITKDDSTTAFTQDLSIFFDFYADKTDIHVGDNEQVTFLAIIDQQTFPQGKPVYLYSGDNNYGEMHDDGLNGDVIANDGTYTFCTSLCQDEQHIDNFYASSDGKCSREFSISFYDDLTYEQLSAGDKILDELTTLTNNKYATGDTNADFELAKQTLAEVKNILDQKKQSGEITSYYENDDGIVFITNTGLEYTFLYECLLHDESLQQPSGGNSSVAEMSRMSAPNGSSGMTATILETWNSSICILKPFNWQHPNDNLDNSSNLITQTGLPYELGAKYENSNVTVEVLKNLQPYHIILIDSHGGKNLICTGETPTNQTMEQYSRDRQAHRIGVCGVSGAENEQFYYVTQDFFSTYYTRGELDDAFIYLGTCHGADSPELSNALQYAGAKTVMAYTNSVYTNYCEQMCETLISKMCMQTSGQYNTVSDALSLAKSELGATDESDNWLTRIIQYLSGRNAAELQLLGDANFTLSTFSGKLTGKVCSAQDQTHTLNNAMIKVYQNETLKAVQYTDANGQFNMILPAGYYQIKVYSPGYMEFKANINVEGNSKLYIETLLMIGNSTGTNGTASGRIINTLMGTGESGVVLNVYPDWNNDTSTEQPIATSTSDSSGNYSLDLPLGNYTVVMSKSGFIDSFFNIVVYDANSPNQDGMITPEIAGNQFLITLTWGEYPDDLDSHVVGTLSNGSTFHVYYHHTDEYDEGINVCNLDYDDTDSYGPEHTTIIGTTEKPYYFYVHRYAGSGSIATSGAKVTVQQGNRIIAQFNAPVDKGNSDYWNVFAITSNGLEVRNTITSSAETGYAS